MPGHFRESRRVTDQQRVGRDDQIGIRDGSFEGFPAGPFGAVMDVDAQLRGEFRRFALPVADQRHRAHQERGTCGPADTLLEEREQLDGLAETHVVGQHAAEASRLEEG